MINRQGIKGLPPGVRIVEYRHLERGGPIINKDGHTYVTLNGCPVLEPDNIYNEIDLESIPIEEGYRRIQGDWFRHCHPTVDYWVDPKTLKVCTPHPNAALPCDPCDVGGDLRRIIVEPLKKMKRVLVVELTPELEQHISPCWWINSTESTEFAWHIEEREEND